MPRTSPSAILAMLLALPAAAAADDGTWWSLRPLERPAPPPVENAAARSPIDAFILARLAESGLAPVPEADRQTLIRRLSFDLHGLPPVPEEVEAFARDPDPAAWERLVDRYLASPRYGERWGRHWLDVVHYADTHGYDKDKRRDHAWRYRDYVIRSLNADKPWGRFIEEQIAGDVLHPGDPEGVIATGFIAAGPWDFVGHVELGETTVEKMKTRSLDRDDMVTTVAASFLSVTAHCSRCHDHKFDPIPQLDYYRLQAVFAGVERGDRSIEDPEAAARRAALERERGELSERRTAIDKEISGKETAAASDPAIARLDAEIAALGGERDRRRGAAGAPASPSNGYHSAIEKTPDRVKWVEVDLGRPVALEAVRLVPARPTDFPDSPGFGFPARFRVEVSAGPGLEPPRTVADWTGEDHPSPGNVPVAIRLDGAPVRTIRVTALRLWKRTNDFVFALAELEAISAGENVARGAQVTALDSIEAGRWSRKHLVDGFDSHWQIADAGAAGPLRDLESRIQELRLERRRLAAAAVDPALREQLSRCEEALAGVEQSLAALPPPPVVYAVKSIPPRPIHLLDRGEVTRPRDETGPGALSAVGGIECEFRIDPPGAEGKRRAALAAWIADPRNPLTWRSIANRVWQYHFGRGLSDTPNDFGRNGSAPSHPELLDWLSVELRDGGGSLKRLHRRILTSAAYRRSSRGDPNALAVDSDNRLLWRMSRRRLDAEEIRDAVLSVAGTLDERMGGPGFDLFDFKDDHSPHYDYVSVDLDRPKLFRRTVYRFTVRSVPNPFLEALDCADPNVSTPVRGTTLTALQALALLNDPFMLQQSKYFSERLRREAAGIDLQVRRACELALARPPRAEEAGALAAHAREFGLENLCRLLLNAGEFVFID